ncbi:unnamed protein product [Echinostoma caproni]|uniref:Aa_trans domain-containing protein n=1 Tax=Echinostoma caproni TaxID=27848 RepID=A0A183AW08_9TREM|nr:unnamed protein product [Echinostoma caproni]
MSKSNGIKNGEPEKQSNRSYSMGNMLNKSSADSVLDSDQKSAKLETFQNQSLSDAQRQSSKTGDTGSVQQTASVNASTPRRRASSDATKNGEEMPVYMRVSDPDCDAGIRRFGHFPIMREDELPGADLDKNSLERNNVVYLLTDSLDGTNDSGVDSPGDSSDMKAESEGPKQNSIVTIFSIWNTMMGTSILAMPWALKEAGFGFGIFLILFVAGIACYTAYLTIKTTDDLRIIKKISKNTFLDLTDACEYHLGKAGRIISLVFSQISLLGAMIVYYVLLSNFLYNTGDFIYRKYI